jgi:hypothetical protein
MVECLPLLSQGAELESTLDPRLKSAGALYFFFVLGVFLVFVPWSPIWDHAILAIAPFKAAGMLGSGWVRGSVSGLGVLDLILAIRESLFLASTSKGV